MRDESTMIYRNSDGECEFFVRDTDGKYRKMEAIDAKSSNAAKTEGDGK